MPVQMIVYMIIFCVGVISIIGGLAYLSIKVEDYFFNK